MRIRLRLTIPKYLERRWNRVRYPSFHPALRIAVLTPELSLGQIARRTRKCRGVAGPPASLRWLADAVESSVVALPLLEGIVAFTGVRNEELSDLERDRFWQVLKTPVYEHRLGPDGTVIAMECEAHELHLLHEEVPLGALRVHLVATPCGCGNRQPRLRRIERISQPLGVAAPVCAAVPTCIDQHRDQEQEQVHAAGRVA